MYEIEPTESFLKWLRGIKDDTTLTKILNRIENARKGNFGKWKTIIGEVREMRIDWGGGYRIYYTMRGNRVIFLLCGGGKKTQAADIKKAQKLAEEL